MYKKLYCISKLFIKLAYYPVDQEDFQGINKKLKSEFKLNFANLKVILNTLNNINLNKYKSRIRKVKTRKQYKNFITDVIAEIHAWLDLINLNPLFQLLQLIKLNKILSMFSAEFSLSRFFNIDSIHYFDLTDQQLKSLNLPLLLNEVESTVQTLISEFSKIENLFNSFKPPTINYIDQEYVDIDSYIISYLEFFVKVIEEYEDIFKIKEENFEEVSKYLNITKESLNLTISQLQERHQPDYTEDAEDEIESLYREVEDLNQDPKNPEEDPKMIEEQEELVREFKERRKLREEIKDPENIKYETWE